MHRTCMPADDGCCSAALMLPWSVVFSAKPLALRPAGTLPLAGYHALFCEAAALLALRQPALYSTFREGIALMGWVHQVRLLMGRTCKCTFGMAQGMGMQMWHGQATCAAFAISPPPGRPSIQL